MIKTFDQACKQLGYDPKKCLPVVTAMPKKFAEAILATATLFIVTEALNEGWEPNWNDSNEAKYFPWWYMNKPGFRLFDFGSYWSPAITGAGSRLCFKSEKLAAHAAKYFKKEYQAMMVIEATPAKPPAKKKK